MRHPAVFAAALSLLALLALLGSFPPSALAAGDCPEGDWFCEPAPALEAPPAPPGPPARPARPERGAGRGEPPPFDPPPPPPRDSYEDERQIRIDVERVRPPRPRRSRGFREWGVNLHVDLGLMGNGANLSPDANMNGFGGALRFRPIPHIAIEGSLELLWGNDYNGFQRFEQALLVNGLFFANPRSAVQLYGIVGLGFGAALLDSGTTAQGEPLLRDETYSYAGGQLGFGIEARVTRHFALGADLMGFLRWRRDPHAADNPEFIDPLTGRTTNTSAGGLVRLGATYYW